APVLTAPTRATVTEEIATAVAGISIADVDSAGDPVSLRLQVANGMLNVSLNGAAVISTGANSSSDLTILGSVADVNASLTGLTYQGNTDVFGTGADTLTLTVNDQGNNGSGGALIDSQSIALDITAVDDLPTLAINTGVTLNEGATVSITNAMLRVDDVDTTASDLVYTLTTVPGTGVLQLNGSDLVTGQTFTQADIDAGRVQYLHDDSENFADSFAFTYRDASSGAQGPQTFSVAMTPVNDNDPVIQSDGAGATANLSINENFTAVTTVTATDADLPSQTISYAVIGGADAGQFTLNAASGEISFTTSVDFENPTDADLDNTYEVIVEASDGLGRTDTQQLLVRVRALNDTDPVITSDGGADNASIAHPENATAVTTITAIDNDVPTQTLSYSIAGGDDAARFSIDPASGELSFLTAPNFETVADTNADNTYDVTVSVSDGVNTDQQFVEVNVQNVNEAPGPITPNAISVSESMRPGSLLSQLIAPDPDANDSSVFTITAGEPGLFILDANSGALTLAPDRNLNYELTSRYDITVQVTDVGGLNSSQQIQIVVLDEPELDVGTGNGADDRPSAAGPGNSPDNLSASEPLIRPDPVSDESTAQAIEERLDRAFSFTSELPALEVGAGADQVVPVVDLFPDLIQRLKSTAEFSSRTLGFDFDLPIPTIEIVVDPSSLEPLVNVRLTVRFDEAAIADLVREPADSFVEFVFDPIKIGSTLVSLGIVWWLTRAGGLITTILMGIPTWRHLDLLPIVSKTFGDNLEPIATKKQLSAEEAFGETISGEFLYRESQGHRFGAPSARG
ncbi:MAG: cadherin-like domain-containing protein, partial [Burkholderiaceae bacterium]